MSQADQNQLFEELQELTNYLSLELAIPLLQNTTDIQFAVQCVNAVLVALNPQWKNIQLHPQNQQELQDAWAQLVAIVEGALLDDQEKILEHGEEIGLENIVMFYEVLCQGCEAIRQDNLQPMNQPQQQIQSKTKKINPENQNSQKFQQQNKRQATTNKKKPQTKTKQVSQKHPHSRPSTGQPQKKAQAVRQLQEEIIQNVAKTMQKKYVTKQEPKRAARIREKQGTQAVEKAKRKLDLAIKDFQVGNRITVIKKQRSCDVKKASLADDAYLKMIKHKHEKMNSQMQNQQLKYYMQLRDKKVSYIRHIHKLIEKLEKERQIDFQKQQREVQKAKKTELKTKISQADNLFHTNMQKLKETYQNKKKIQQMQSVGDLEVCRAMEKQIESKKALEVQQITNLWEEERKQLFKITGNQEKMREKLIHIYRKFRV